LALLLRIIRQARWLSAWETLDTEDIADNDVPADPVADLDTKQNKLSVYVVADDRSDLGRIVAALAANRPQLQKLDYALFDERTIPTISIKAQKTKGQTPDDGVNDKHLDLVALTGLKLVALARAILDQAQIERKPPKDVAALIRTEAKSGALDMDRCKLEPQERRKIETL